MRRRLVIMVRAPVMGRVKSRLAADIGWVAATAFYRRELSRLMRVLGSDPRWQTLLAVTPDNCLGEAPWPATLSRVAQGAGDLGARLMRVMYSMPPGPVVIIGSDVPLLGAGHIADAFAALGGDDAVIGPSPDGGYYLIGLRRVPAVRNIFRNVRWSSRHTLEDTLANLEGVRTSLLEPLGDIDTGSDWHAWRAGRGLTPP